MRHVKVLKYRKTIAGCCIAAVMAAGLALYFWRAPKEVPITAAYIIDKNKDINLRKLLKVVGKSEFSDSEINRYFSKGVVNDYTVNFFRSLQWRFRSSTDLNSHYRDVCGYLSSRKPPVKHAEELCELYKLFTEYEMGLDERMTSYGNPRNSTEALALLRKEQDFRRTFFGADMADALFRAEIKSQEYSIRRAAIVNNSTLYGDVKMSMIADLNAEMWGSEADELDKASIMSDPYNKYREKLVIYDKDMREMTPEAKADFIHATRKEFFSEEVVKRFEELDAEKVLDKDKLAEYYGREKAITGNPALSDEDREQAVRDLQVEMFGKEGSMAFRRMEALRRQGGG